MRYAGIIKNDTAAGPGLCFSFYTQGCNRHCPGCHNPETWDFAGGKEFTKDTLNTILEGISANGIVRPLCILGGEPLCPDNQFLTRMIITEVRKQYPDLPIYLWTGYYYEDLDINESPHLKHIINNINYLIDGPFMMERRDITLFLRGSSNQRIFKREDQKFNIIN